MPKRVLSVGQCAADQWQIERVLSQHFEAEVVSADTCAQACDALKKDAIDLVLVNRVFDHDGASGLDFIRALKNDEQTSRVPVILVSNFADAQKDAAALGALPGFGKAALGDVHTVDRLRQALGDAN